jgi:hypothetical protein
LAGFIASIPAFTPPPLSWYWGTHPHVPCVDFPISICSRVVFLVSIFTRHLISDITGMAKSPFMNLISESEFGGQLILYSVAFLRVRVLLCCFDIFIVLFHLMQCLPSSSFPDMMGILICNCGLFLFSFHSGTLWTF